MGDRVAVLRDGYLQQCATPQTLYDHPSNLFVAAFIGSPAMNLFEATLGPDATTVTVGSARLDVPETLRHARPRLAAYAGRTVVVGIRPEHLSVDTHSRNGETLESRVDLVETLGSEQIIHFDIDVNGARSDGVLDDAAVLSSGETAVQGEGVARVGPRIRVNSGEKLRLAVDLQELHFFDPTTNDAIWK